MKNMLNSFKLYTNQTGVKINILITLFSLLFLIITLLGVELENKTLENICFISIIIEFIYGITYGFLILRNRSKYNHIIPFLFLNWFIGCFATNIFINIFENLSVWVYIVTFLFCLTNFFIYSHYKNKIITPLSYFLNGICFLMIVYFAIFLIPVTPYSFLGILALGLGFYGLVPMIVLLVHAINLLKNETNNKKNFLLFGAGVALVIAGLSTFIYLINRESEKIAEKTVTKSFEINDDLPSFIIISQNLKPNYFNEIILKKDIVYVFTENFFEFRKLGSFGNKQYNERKTHNPIVNLAYLFSKKLDLSVDDRINILKSNFDKRLETEEQLWSGADLITKNIKEDVKIYTDNRLAYTEITMDVACAKNTWKQKEAIYSFQLPEGAVATSLSLWVNGIERKGVLTTKEKATKAYNQIVKVEYRDPSLMQWKED